VKIVRLVRALCCALFGHDLVEQRLPYRVRFCYRCAYLWVDFPPGCNAVTILTVTDESGRIVQFP
jgi:hypothetical protein